MTEQLVIQECSMPVCKPDEVLVQIKAAGINFIDVYFRSGLYKSPYYPSRNPLSLANSTTKKHLQEFAKKYKPK